MRPYASRPARDGDFAASRTRLEDMVETLSAPVMMAASQATLEEYVTEAGRELQRQLMQDQLDARARAEERRPVVRGSEGITRTRAEPGHRRMIATTVGRVETERIAYRAEGKGVGNLHPADAVLELPARLYSQPLRKLIAVEVARSPARQAAQSVSRITGQHLGTRQLMATAQHAAADILDFYTPALTVTGEVVVPATTALVPHTSLLSAGPSGFLRYEEGRGQLSTSYDGVDTVIDAFGTDAYGVTSAGAGSDVVASTTARPGP